MAIKAPCTRCCAYIIERIKCACCRLHRNLARGAVGKGNLGRLRADDGLQSLLCGLARRVADGIEWARKAQAHTKVSLIVWIAQATGTLGQAVCVPLACAKAIACTIARCAFGTVVVDELLAVGGAVLGTTQQRCSVTRTILWIAEALLACGVERAVAANARAC